MTFNWVLFSEVHFLNISPHKPEYRYTSVSVRAHTHAFHINDHVIHARFSNHYLKTMTWVFKEVKLASHIMAPSYLCSKYQYMLKLKNEKGTNIVSLNLSLKNGYPMVLFLISNIWNHSILYMEKCQKGNGSRLIV